MTDMDFTLDNQLPLINLGPQPGDLEMVGCDDDGSPIYLVVEEPEYPLFMGLDEGGKEVWS